MMYLSIFVGMSKAQENAEPPASGLGFGHLVNLHHSSIVSRYGGQGWGWAFLQVEGWRCELVSTRAEVNDPSQPFKLVLQALIIMIQHGQEGHFGDSGMYVCVCGFDDH
jgi:hypothetical protein